MKRKQFMALLMAAMLGLAGCGASGESADTDGGAVRSENQEAGDAQAEASGPSEDGTEEAGKTEEYKAILETAEADVVSYLTDGAVKSGDVLAEKDGFTLTAAEASFYIAYQYFNAVNYYQRNGMTFSLDDAAADGLTAGQYMVKYAGEQAVNYLAAQAKAADLGVTLSEEEQASLDTFLEDNYRSSGETRWYSELGAGMVNEDDYDEAGKEAWIMDKGRTMFAHNMLTMGTTPEDYKTYVEKYYNVLALQDYLYGEGGEYSLTEDELAQRTSDYIEENGVLWGRCILFSTINATEEEAEKARQQMETVYEELSGLSGQELYDRFTVHQGTYDTSGYTAGEIQMYTNQDSLVPGYYEKLAELSEGELGVTERTAYGWFILLRETAQPSLLTDTVRSLYVNESFGAYLDEAVNEYGLDPAAVFSDLDTGLYYERLDTLKEAVPAIDQVYSEHPAGEASEAADNVDPETAGN